MNSWLKTGKGMMSHLIDKVASAPQPMPVTKRSKKKAHNKDDNSTEPMVLFTSLNQDCSYVCCGTSNGFRVFRSKPFEQIFESKDIIPLKLTMLFDKSLIAILTEKIDKKKIEIEEKIEKEYQLQLYDIKNREFIWSVSPSMSMDGYDGTSSSLKNLKFAMNKTRLVITNLNSDNSLSLFDITNKMKPLYPSIMTYDNNGIFDLCQDTDNCLLAYCDQSGKGRIGIIDAFNLQKKLIIDAHDSSIQIIKFNYNGNYIASASNKGTLIRIFHLYQNNRYRNIATFRRGTFNTKIHCLSFNPSSTKLCCSSLNSDTIHIFNLDEVITSTTTDTNQAIDNNVTVLPKLNVVTDYLPVSVKNTIEFPRSCIDIQIKTNTHSHSSLHSHFDGIYDSSENDEQDMIKMQCGFIDDNSIVITTQNGYFYRYFINENAKEDKYRLLSEHSLKQNDDDLFHQQTKIFQLPGDGDGDGDDNNNNIVNEEHAQNQHHNNQEQENQSQQQLQSQSQSQSPPHINHHHMHDQHMKKQENENMNINTMEHISNAMNSNINLNVNSHEQAGHDDDDDDVPYIQYSQFEPGSMKMKYGHEHNDNEQEEERKENNDRYNYNETTDDIIPSPPESPASQSPEIFNTDYQNTINENDNFKLDLQSNYT